jgi:hypothetical protein
VFNKYFVEPSEAAYLHWMTRMVRASALPFTERVPAMKQVEKDSSRTMLGSPSKLLASIVMPVLSGGAYRSQYQDACRQVTRAAATVMAYRAANGTYPKRLEDAMAAPPTDAFTGKPLVYTRESGGFVVSSAGDPETSKSAPSFRYPAPAPSAGGKPR